MLKTKHTFLVLLAGIAFIIAGCDSGGGNENTGTVTGRITAADGKTAITGATVGLAASSKSKSDDGSVPLQKVRRTKTTVDPNGPSTTTNENGEYTLSGVPAGKQTLAAKKGAFESTFSVDVTANETVQSDENQSQVQPSKDLAVVLGSYDSIEEIVIDLGYESYLDTLNAGQLSKSSTLENYSIVFINCGSGGSATLPDDRVSALRDYINNGGTLYVSDLEQDYAEEIFPGTASFKNNTSTQTVAANISSNDLQKFVGKSSVDIKYDFSSWERVVSTSDTTSYPTPETLLSGQPKELNSGTEPLAITYDTGPGRFVYTTFHNEAGATSDQRVVLKYYVFLP